MVTRENWMCPFQIALITK